MPVFFAEKALVGSDLNLKENVYIITTTDFSNTPGLIKSVTEEKPKISVDEEFCDVLLIPGFVNGHTHIGDSVAKDLGYGVEIEDVVGPQGMKFKIFEKIEREDLVKAMRDAVFEMLSGGITTFADFRESGIFGLELLKEAVRDLPIKAIVLGRPSNSLEDSVKVLDSCDGFGLPSVYQYTEEEIKTLSEMCLKKGKLLATHVLETKNNYSNSKIAPGDELNQVLRYFKKPSFLVHLTHANSDQLRKVAEYGIGVVCCPRGNAYFGIGFPPVAEMLKAGIKPSLGTDNQISCSANMFSEMEFLIRGSRLFRKKVLNPKEVLKMATVNGGKILKRNIGVIEEGASADFILIDLKAPNIKYSSDIYKGLTLRTNPKNVKQVFIEGTEVKKFQED